MYKLVAVFILLLGIDMPNKADYRRKIREKYEGKPSYDPDAVYDPNSINEVLYRQPF